MLRCEAGGHDEKCVVDMVDYLVEDGEREVGDGTALKPGFGWM